MLMFSLIDFYGYLKRPSCVAYFLLLTLCWFSFVRQDNILFPSAAWLLWLMTWPCVAQWTRTSPAINVSFLQVIADLCWLNHQHNCVPNLLFRLSSGDPDKPNKTAWMMMKMIVKGGLHPIPGLPRLRHDHLPSMSGVILTKVIYH